MIYSLCNYWEFVREWFDGFAVGEGAGERVRLPHNVQEMPQHYSDHKAYQTVCGYRMSLFTGEDVKGKRLFLQFDGAAHIATVYINGKLQNECTTNTTDGYIALQSEGGPIEFRNLYITAE